MWIVRLALRRPYTFVVGALVLLLLTPLVLLRTPTDIFPEINIPVISVVWQYAGLNATEIEHRLIYLHERALSATVNDVEHFESNSYNGTGVIKIFLQPGASVDAGVAQVTAIAQTILRQMPPGQTPPLIIRYNASTVPILQYAVSSKQLAEQELYDLSQNQIRVGLSTVRGAAVPWPYGGKTRLVSVDLDLAALKSKNLAPQDVVNAINAQNLILPSGTTKIGSTEYDVELNTSPKVLDELNDLPIKTVNGATLYVRDVAQVRDGYQPQVNVVRQDGVRGSLLTILKSGSASTLDVVSRVKAAMPRILSGLALAVGILVDDATVAIENIHRQMATGKPLTQAILDGAQEIALPAFVSTLCICIVFVPMFFLTGVARYLFVPLAEAVVFAMLASYLLSRTLIPTLVMWFYRGVHEQEREGKTFVLLWPIAKAQQIFEDGFERVREGYCALLSAVLH